MSESYGLIECDWVVFDEVKIIDAGCVGRYESVVLIESQKPDGIYIDFKRPRRSGQRRYANKFKNRRYLQ